MPTGEYIRGLVTYDELEYTHPDTAAIARHIQEVLDMLTDGTDSESIREAYESLSDEFIEMQTQYNLANLFSSIDVNDEYYKNETESLSEESSKLAVDVTKLEVAIYESEHKDVVFYDWTEEDFRMLRIAEKLYDDEYVELNTRSTEIVNEYWDAMTNTTIRYQDQDLTLNELMEVEWPSNQQYYNFLEKYYKTVNRKVGALYLELIQINKRIAEKAGYDSYPEFSYDFEYERDYTVEDSQRLWSYVKKYVLNEAQDLYYDMTNQEYNAMRQAQNATDQIALRQEEIQAHAEEISPWMAEALQYLIDYQLSVITDSDTSQSGAYTTYFTNYDVPFIYIHEGNGYEDVFTFIHEFGHFYSDYLGGADYARYASLDLKEISSQGNELLFLPKMKELYPKTTYNGILKMKLYNYLDTMIQACLYDEFQQYVYTHDIEDLDALNDAYVNISSSYGIGEGYYVISTRYLWVDVMHNFEAPMYYISYGTSVIPALEIFDISLDDRAYAIQVYNRVASADPELSFGETLEEIGLKSPFEEQTIIDIVNAIVDYSGVGYRVGG